LRDAATGWRERRFAGLGDPLPLLFEHGAGEEFLEFHPHVERLVDLAGQAGGLEAVAAQLEKVVRHADRIPLQDFPPQGGQPGFGFVAGRHVFGHRRGPRRFGIGQPLLVYLTAGRQGPRFEGYPPGGHHVGRQGRAA
jgi:hypothetical protein